MPSVLATVVGVDAQPYKTGMEELPKIAAKAGERIRVNLQKSAGFSGGWSGGFGTVFGNIEKGAEGAKEKIQGMRTVFRELLVIGREIGRGNWARVPGSITVMLGAMGGAITPLSALLGVIIGIGAALGIAYIRFKALTEELSGIELPDFNPDYIAKHLKGVNQIAEGWRLINKAVAEALEKYNDVASAAERTRKAADEQYSHEQKMRSLERDRELNSAGHDPEKRAQIEGKYTALSLADERDKHAADLIRLRTEGERLADEANENKDKADKLSRGLPSAEQDKILIEKAKKNRDAAHEALGKLPTDSGVWQQTKDGFTTGFNLDELKAIQAARAKVRSDAAQYDKEYRDAVDRGAANDLSRSERDRLTKKSEEYLVKANLIQADLPNKAKEFNQDERNRYSEAVAKLQAENARPTQLERGAVNSLQRQGAYASPAETASLDVQKRMEQQLKIIADILKNHPPTSAAPFGGVRH